MTYENQDRYKQLISDFEAVLQWKRIRELLDSELFSVLETSIIELTDAEIADMQAAQAQAELDQAAQDAADAEKATAKAALLKRLGITADEAALLLA
jgi:hypothetical protein